MKISTERALFNSIIQPSSRFSLAVVVDAVECTDEKDVANTYRKREDFAKAVTAAMKQAVTDRTEVCTKYENDKELEKYIMKKMDFAAIAGYLIGRYAPNNEILEQLAEQLNEHEETKLPPELIKQVRKKLIESMKKSGTEFPGLEEYYERN